MKTEPIQVVFSGGPKNGEVMTFPSDQVRATFHETLVEPRLISGDSSKPLPFKEFHYEFEPLHIYDDKIYIGRLSDESMLQAVTRIIEGFCELSAINRENRGRIVSGRQSGRQIRDIL